MIPQAADEGRGREEDSVRPFHRPSAARVLATASAVVITAGGLTAAGTPTAVAATTPAVNADATVLHAGQSLLRWTPEGTDGITGVVSPHGRFRLALSIWGDEATEFGVSTQLDLSQHGEGGDSTAWLLRRDQSHAGPQARLTMQTDGNLVLYARPGRALWSTRTNGTGGANRLVVQDDGNLVVLTGANRVVWSTGSHTVSLYQGETLAPGQYLKSVLPGDELPTTVAMRTDGDLVVFEGTVAVWASNTTTPGASLTLQADGNLVVHAGGRPLWSSGTAGIAGGHDDGAVLFTAGHWLRANARLEQGPGWHAGPAQTTRWDTIDGPGERGLLGGPPGRRVLTGPAEYGATGSTLRAGQYLGSSNGYRLTMQPDGNLVERAPSGRAVWTSQTAGHPGAVFVVQGDGNLVIRAGGRAIWNSRTAATSYDDLTVNVTCGTDGNIVARTHDGGVAWSTGPVRG